jgi:hypothetical protein
MRFFLIFLVIFYAILLLSCAPPRATYHKVEETKMSYIECYDNYNRTYYRAYGWVLDRNRYGIWWQENNPYGTRVFIISRCNVSQSE